MLFFLELGRRDHQLAEPLDGIGDPLHLLDAALVGAGVVVHRTAHGAGGLTRLAAWAVAVTFTARGLLGIAVDIAGGIEGPYEPLDLAIYSPTALAIGLGAAWLLRTSPEAGTRAPAVLSPFPKKMSEAAL
jgi:hypothetical protein